MQNKLFTLLKGFIIGGTMLVPGVSGGSMAMILGIYEDLITAVSRFFKQKTKSIIFLGIFCIGAFSGMALFAKSLLKLLNTYNMPMMYLFIGCIVGGIPMIIKSCQLERLSISTAIYPIIGAVIVLSITLIPHGLFGTFNGFTLQNALILFVAGFFAAIALILPGISVSFVLLVLGIYEQLIKAFNDFNIIYLSVIGAGLVFGIISTTKILEYAMNKHKRPTYLIILGFIIGSVIPVFPGAPHGIDIFICPIALIIGIALIQLLFKLDSSQ